MVRVVLLVANILVLAGVSSLIINSRSSDAAVHQNAPSIGLEQSVNPLDQLSSADIAVQVARLVNLPEERAVTNRADTVNAQLSVSAADSTVIAKPQIVETNLKSIKDLRFYTTKSGDTVGDLAAKFNITSDTIRWSNNLNGDTLAPGQKLVISPVSGVVYLVKSGDTAESLASKYNSSASQIIDFNDAYHGLKPGTYVVIPNGSESVAAGPAAVNFGFDLGSPVSFSPVYGSNGYDVGYCTWWAAFRRAQVGKPIPNNLGNASSWLYLAQRAGYKTSNRPAKFAVIWFPPLNYYGHVGFVESVNADGSIDISEMNATYGYNQVDRRTIPASQVSIYSYIY